MTIASMSGSHYLSAGTRHVVPHPEGIARQIAEALEAAHEQGVIHRDLKPANVKVRPDGTVRVLDFGLAKLAEPTAASNASPAALSMSPTITSPALVSGVGVLLGTAAYMSPEQAKGRPADKRSDIWAFGCVLYEMLTATRAFDGNDVAETLAGVLRAEPNWHELPSATPDSIHRLLRRCLAKDVHERLQHIGDARLELSDGLNDVRSAVMPPARSAQRNLLPWSVALVALLIAVGFGLRALRPTPPRQQLHVEIETPPTTDPTSFAISPDGHTIAFVATSEAGTLLLWVRSLAFPSARPLARTEGAFNPFWSPDGQSIGFFANQMLMRVDIDTGTVQSLGRASGSGMGGTWSRANMIYFVPTNGSPIQRISAAGGQMAALTSSRRRPTFPQFLADNHRFIYYGLDETGRWGVYVADSDGSDGRRLLEADAAAVVDKANQVYFVRQGALFRQALDPSRMETTGSPQRIADDILVYSGQAALSVSSSGTIAYRANLPEEQSQLAWYDRTGQRLQTVGEPVLGVLAGSLSPALSPDDSRVALSVRSNEGDRNQSIWVLDISRRLRSRVTFATASDAGPVWSPDGTTIVFSRNNRLFEKNVTSPGGDNPIENVAGIACDWSRDGRFLLFRAPDPKTGYNVWALPMRGERKPFPVMQTEFDEADAQFAPDAKWIAYQSNKSGRFEIYLQAFPNSTNEIQVSLDGGTQVRWRPDGKELFYVAPDGWLMAASVSFPHSSRIQVGAPVRLFRTNLAGAGRFCSESSAVHGVVGRSTISHE